MFEFMLQPMFVLGVLSGLAILSIYWLRGWWLRRRKAKKVLALYQATCVHVLGKPRAVNRADRRKVASHIRRNIYR